MSTNIPQKQQTEQRDREQSGGKMGWKHWWLMLLCCLPMIAIAILILVGAWGIR